MTEYNYLKLIRLYNRGLIFSFNNKEQQLVKSFMEMISVMPKAKEEFILYMNGLDCAEISQQIPNRSYQTIASTIHYTKKRVLKILDTMGVNFENLTHNELDFAINAINKYNKVQKEKQNKVDFALNKQLKDSILIDKAGLDKYDTIIAVSTIDTMREYLKCYSLNYASYIKKQLNDDVIKYVHYLYTSNSLTDEDLAIKKQLDVIMNTK